jgi:hypothetical protein
MAMFDDGIVQPEVTTALMASLDEIGRTGSFLVHCESDSIELLFRNLHLGNDPVTVKKCPWICGMLGFPR